MTIHCRDLTVVIPSFNMQELTGRAVGSVLRNDSDVSVLVVDDGSSPPIALPPALMETDQVTLVRHEKNRGASAARNTGIAHAKTGWISFLDADDVLLPDTLSRRLAIVGKACIDRADRDVSKTIFGCGWVEEISGGSRIRIPRPGQTIEQFASGCWYCPGSAIIAHRSVFESDTALYNENLRRLEDYEWGLRFAQRGGELVVLEEAGAAIRPSNRVNFKTIDAAARDITERHEWLRHDNRPAWRAMQAYLALEKATAAWRDGLIWTAMRSLAASLRHKPRLNRHFSPGWTFGKM